MRVQQILVIVFLMMFGVGFIPKANAYDNLMMPSEQGRVVKVADYWPRTNKVEVLRKAGGTVYSRVHTRNYYLIHPEHHLPYGANDDIISRTYFYNLGHEKLTYLSEMIFSLSPNGGVQELGGLPDPYYATNPSSTWHGTHLTKYRTQNGGVAALSWGIDGGQVAGFPWTPIQHANVVFGPRYGNIVPIGKTFGTSRIMNVYDVYQPECGRNERFEWTCEGGHTYLDVIHVRFFHATRYGQITNVPECPGAEIYHNPGYSAIVVDMWLDRDGVVIKEDTVLSEGWAGSCIGSYDSEDPVLDAQYYDPYPEMSLGGQQ